MKKTILFTSCLTALLWNSDTWASPQFDFSFLMGLFDRENLSPERRPRLLSLEALEEINDHLDETDDTTISSTMPMQFNRPLFSGFGMLTRQETALREYYALNNRRMEEIQDEVLQESEFNSVARRLLEPEEEMASQESEEEPSDLSQPLNLALQKSVNFSSANDRENSEVRPEDLRWSLILALQESVILSSDHRLPDEPNGADCENDLASDLLSPVLVRCDSSQLEKQAQEEGEDSWPDHRLRSLLGLSVIKEDMQEEEMTSREHHGENEFFPHIRGATSHEFPDRDILLEPQESSSSQEETALTKLAKKTVSRSDGNEGEPRFVFEYEEIIERFPVMERKPEGELSLVRKSNTMMEQKEEAAKIESQEDELASPMQLPKKNSLDKKSSGERRGPLKGMNKIRALKNELVRQKNEASVAQRIILDRAPDAPSNQSNIAVIRAEMVVDPTLYVPLFVTQLPLSIVLKMPPKIKVMQESKKQ